MAPGDDEGAPYSAATFWRHLVHTYTGLNFNEIGQLNYVDFLQYRRDAFIQRCSATEEGRQHLHDCARMEQTKPDRGKLNTMFGKGAASGGK